MACPECGAENVDGAERCIRCGADLAPPVSPAAPPSTQVTPPPPQPEAKTFERQMEDLGKRIGVAGQGMGREAGRAGTRLQSQWYGTLGLLAPVVEALIATIVFMVFVVVVGAVAISSPHRGFWDELRNFLETYFLLFMGLFFLSAFENYFNKVYRRTLRWVTPIMAAVGAVVWAWIAAQVLFIGARTLDEPFLRDFGDFITVILPLIFAIVLLVGYLIAILQFLTERNEMTGADSA